MENVRKKGEYWHPSGPPKGVHQCDDCLEWSRFAVADGEKMRHFCPKCLRKYKEVLEKDPLHNPEFVKEVQGVLDVLKR